MKANPHIIIFDTTLRDGEQCPGAAMTYPEKIVIAEALDAMGVDVIEAGFAAASLGDLECIQEIAKRSKNAVICSLARAKKSDIDASAEAVKDAQRPRIHTFIGTSPGHRKHQLKMSKDQVLAAIHESVHYARNRCDDIEWSAMDATRTEIDFLAQAIEVAIHAGARTINLPDTVGYTVPHEYAAMIRILREKVPTLDKAIISVHCHNDLGMAVANSLAGVDAGARQIECAINGLGERAGNAALEEIVMAIKTRQDILPYQTQIETKHIARISKLVSSTTGFAIQKNKAIVGANAFSHASGIHQDGVLKAKETFEIMQPESIGLHQTELALGKHSGRAAVKDRLNTLGIKLEDEAHFAAFFNRFKELGDRKKQLFDEDLITLLADSKQKVEQKFEFCSFNISGSSAGVQSAMVKLKVRNQEKIAFAEGDGPIDAIFTAINTLSEYPPTLDSYHVHSITQGPDAQAKTTISLKQQDRLFTGTGRDTDTIVSATKAYIHALNKIENYYAMQAVPTIITPSKKKADYIWLNGEFVPWDDANAHSMTHGVHYGSAVFEGERAYQGVIFKSMEHNERFHRSGAMLDMEIPYSVEELEAVKYELLRRNNLSDAYIRPIAWRGAENLTVASHQCSVHVAIAAWHWHSYFGDINIMETGLKLMWSEWARPSPQTAPVAAKASGLYIIGSLSKNKAEQMGFNDALMLDYRGYVAECTGANFFMVQNGEIHTPIADCFLDGITRRTAIDIARSHKIKVIERYIKPEEVKDADEIFITGTAVEICPVTQVGDQYFSIGPVARKIASEYARLVGAR